MSFFCEFIKEECHLLKMQEKKLSCSRQRRVSPGQDARDENGLASSKGECHLLNMQKKN
jgi:hypothetical protein